MFTARELNVLQASLRSWRGPYRDDQALTEAEIQRAWSLLATRDQLADRIEEILHERHVWDETARMVMPLAR